MKGLEVWNAVKKYLNFYHHQSVKKNIDVETVEGMPIDTIEKELKALDIIKRNPNLITWCIETYEDYQEYCNEVAEEEELIESEEEFYLLKEVLL